MIFRIIDINFLFSTSDTFRREKSNREVRKTRVKRSMNIFQSMNKNRFVVIEMREHGIACGLTLSSNIEHWKIGKSSSCKNMWKCSGCNAKAYQNVVKTRTDFSAKCKFHHELTLRNWTKIFSDVESVVFLIFPIFCAAELNLELILNTKFLYFVGALNNMKEEFVMNFLRFLA